MVSAKLLHRLAMAALLLVCPMHPPWATGSEQAVIAVIVAKNGPDQALDKNALARIFLRKTLLWASGETIRPVNLSAAHPMRRLFSERVAGLDPEELEDYWNDQYFHGIFPPYAVASEEAAIRYVSESATAIGYVSACALDGRVRALLYLTTTGIAKDESVALFCPER
jgi:ABC-type phosphate transport system substrate-binding protein